MKRVYSYVAGLAILTMTFAAHAGSYQLNDYSVTGLGRSYAGQGIMGDDYSAIAFNPAGMTLMKKSGVQQALSMINLKSDLKQIGGAGSKAKMDFWQPVPAGFAQYNVNDKLFLGLGIYGSYGLKTEYKSNWFGKYSAILSKLDIVDFNISAAYKLTQHWSVGASAILRYIYGRMTQKYPTGTPYDMDINFNVHGWSQTGTLGVMYEVDDKTRFGLSYRLRSAQRAKGLFKRTAENPALAAMNGTFDVNANPDLPETFTFSAYHRYKDLGFSGTARWTHWTSSFPNFTIRSPGLGGEKVTEYRYQNTWTLTGGVDYYYNQNWTFRMGGGWDESPTHKPERRTFRIPDNDRWWMSVGASYAKNNWQIDAAYAHMIGKTGVADEGALKAKYKNLQSNILGVQVQYKF
ncbi:MAG: OmpP1/FadL family transporter [Pseudomonadota bacterium]|nr:OmpP1/FadL family transporter [Pseudomonadota bacterium]